MKSLVLAASAAAAACAIPAIASAQTATAPTGAYATLGYADADTGGVNLGAIQGRLGWRFNNWLGVEGELAGGVKGDHLDVPTGLASPATARADVKLRHEEAIYGVGFLPLSPQWDLLARVGYGNQTIKASAPGFPGAAAEASGRSWNYGAGAQYHWDVANGIRADYTREEFTHGTSGHANVWAVAYSHRF
ncbi:MAG TPA: outer membrane beta-barrel protein [Phenylobacterium sp.]|jgi:hypothetical protein|nr:outer membrane beta-barrel protein [Phenylobacterium sp.]